jgi:hypothetical protein
MADTYLFSMATPIENVASRITEYIGPQADYCNYLPLIEIVLESMFFGQVFCADGSAANVLKGYGVPDDIAEDVAQQLMDDVKMPIGRGLEGGIDPNRSYHFKLSNLGDLELIDLGESGPPHNPLTAIKENINKSLENGDWYPERIRQFASG